MSKLSDLLADLGTRGPVRHVGESSWRCRCPAHADKNGSLYVSAGDGRILVYCHGGCDYRSILAALDLTEAALFDEEVGADGKFEVKRLRRPLPMAEADRRASAYALLTEALVLLDEDREALRRRGLSDERIDANGYRSLRPLAAARAAHHVAEVLGPDAYRIPGIIRDARGEATLSVRFGILIPVRDLAGRLVAAQVRTHEEGRKYVWLSSLALHSGTHAHCCLGLHADYTGPVRVTEGPLKADVATHLDPSVPCIGVPGITNADDALIPLAAMKPSEVRSCFDADVWSGGLSDAERLIRGFNDRLVAAGHRVVLEWWPAAEGKGIDDLLLAGSYPERAEEGPVPEETAA